MHLTFNPRVMPHSIFISTVYEDSPLIFQLEVWARENRLGNQVVVTHETKDLRTFGYDAIRKHLRTKIEGASAVLILVGRDTHNHDWISVEVELANSFNKKLVVVRIPNTSGNFPPILVNHSIIEFKPDSIRQALGY
jgi:MTH538 TIR-like domain (DUF1863)